MLDLSASRASSSGLVIDEIATRGAVPLLDLLEVTDLGPALGKRRSCPIGRGQRRGRSPSSTSSGDREARATAEAVLSTRGSPVRPSCARSEPDYGLGKEPEHVPP